MLAVSRFLITKNLKFQWPNVQFWNVISNLTQTAKRNYVGLDVSLVFHSREIANGLFSIKFDLVSRPYNTEQHSLLFFGVFDFFALWLNLMKLVQEGNVFVVHVELRALIWHLSHQFLAQLWSSAQLSYCPPVLSSVHPFIWSSVC